MHGQNTIHKEFASSDTIVVHSIFPTLQGEGPDAGRPCIFIRLAHCNLACYFCDTEFDKGTIYSYSDLNAKLLDLLAHYKYTLVVITGGEPLLQNLAPIITVMNRHGIAVSVETAGSIGQDYLHAFFAHDRSINNNLIVCSPKTPKVNATLVPIVGAWKYIIKSGEADLDDGLPIMSTQNRGKLAQIYRPHSSRVPIYVQPMDEGEEHLNHVNLIAAVNSSLRFGYRLSLQLHKLAGLD